ncbi:hypothetical protein C5E08_00700 [Rathayibacter iranicus]|uniref:TetR family transcriptional regulator n=3 Tax=Rathayibacter iranicus TaxID=59737 RepID=A0AAD1AA77_9MICO|nr:TetR family transcriptional regulator [Rathayibacter iranicus]MWV30339.1 TetR family transcriptional regulator [Rathayibacter iranicus NCPPB 2253 = VKM Ac-1602]PPI51502.1 hypothetical protein C5E09_00700 [Rathayibacter iranicus]PPI63531.1 hypothetical protein C5E08_00700 [Rathayibacter iranicus]PPI74422.1 hypothetical protein C5E01_00680 [Rathayibacter iranicus]
MNTVQVVCVRMCNVLGLWLAAGCGSYEWYVHGMGSNTGTKEGRPRDAAISRALIRAAERLMESDGFDKLTVDGIVSEVGTTRQTFYRRYKSVSLLALEILLERFGRQEEIDTGNLSSDLLELLRTDVAMMTSPLIRKNLTGLLEDMRTDDEIRARYLKEVIYSRREVVSRVLERAKARGEITRDDTDSEYICDLMFGPALSRVVLQTGAPIDDRLARQIVASLMRELC